ncbi:HAD family hydrolase [Zobellella endophytica]|uniref:HAD family hydrolase n=1 Tax=Zobellella endophytica TaxID=2116700 RepID=A0A2P7RCT6_9GAMM|nr:HAD family hydrolase [Zobellella endophytica]
MQQLLEHLQQQQLLELPSAPVYVKVSRTLLFRALLGEPELWPVALKNSFNGKVSELFSSRFGLQRHEYESVLPSELLEQAINLPEDMDQLVSRVSEFNTPLQALVAPTRAGVCAYFQQQGLADAEKLLLLDVGYSGTIQKLLTRLLQRDTHGFYFIATKPGAAKVDQHTAFMQGTFKEGVALGDGYHLLDRSLFIECLLTAPHGQVVDIRQEHDGRFRFYYGRKAATQRHFQDLQAVHHGAVEGVAHALRHGVDYSVEEIELLYKTFLSSRSALPPGVWHLFSADDDISGNGIVNPLDLFAI